MRRHCLHKNRNSKNLSDIGYTYILQIDIWVEVLDLLLCARKIRLPSNLCLDINSWNCGTVMNHIRCSRWARKPLATPLTGLARILSLFWKPCRQGILDGKPNHGEAVEHPEKWAHLSILHHYKCTCWKVIFSASCRATWETSKIIAKNF